MSHLHFPDGILPIWLVVVGLILTLIFLLLAVRKIEKDKLYVKKISMLAVISALMIIAMSIPLGFIHYHINLTILVTLLTGPWMAFIAVFIVNLFLSLVGHGGITVVGLNTLVVGSEVLFASIFFTKFRKILSPIPSVVITTIISLILSSGVMVATVALAAKVSNVSAIEQYVEKGSVLYYGIPSWFFLIIIPIVIAGALVESIVTAIIVKYLKKAKPSIVKDIYLPENIEKDVKA